MAVLRAIQNLFTWKVAFLQAQINDINAHIRGNNAAIRRMRRMPDTEQQIESLEHQNLGLEETKKGLEDELERFNRGSEGKKIDMARRTSGTKSTVSSSKLSRRTPLRLPLSDERPG